MGRRRRPAPARRACCTCRRPFPCAAAAARGRRCAWPARHSAATHPSAAAALEQWQALSAAPTSYRRRRLLQRPLPEAPRGQDRGWRCHGCRCSSRPHPAHQRQREQRRRPQPAAARAEPQHAAPAHQHAARHAPLSSSSWAGQRARGGPAVPPAGRHAPGLQTPCAALQRSRGLRPCGARWCRGDGRPSARGMLRSGHLLSLQLHSTEEAGGTAGPAEQVGA